MLKPEFCSIAAQLGSWDSGEGARPAGLRSPSPVALEGGFPPATPSTSASPAVICPKHLLPPAPPAAPVWPGPAEAAGAAVPLEQALWQRRLCGSPRARGRRRSPRAERCRSRRTGCLATSPGRRAIAEPGRSPPPPRPPFHSASALPATPGCPAPLAVPTAGAEAQGGGSVPHLRRPPGGRAGRWRPAGSALTPLPAARCSRLAAAPALSAVPGYKDVLRGSGGCSRQLMEMEGSVRAPLSLARGKLRLASLLEPGLGLRKR